MALALLLVRLALAAVFVASATGKLLDLAGSRKALAEFGVPVWLVAPAGWLLPLVELAVVLALLPVASAWIGALAAIVLLASFTAAIGVALARGSRPDCHCFGALSPGESRPIGWRSLARNAVLLGLAGYVAIWGRAGAGTDILRPLGGGNMTAWLGVALGVTALALAATALWLLLQVIAQNGRLLRRLDQLEQRPLASDVASAAQAQAVATPAAGLPVGSAAPAFQLPGLHGETLTLEALRAAARPLLLAFTDPNCGPCSALLPDLARWQRELAGSVTLTVLSRGSVAEHLTKATEHGLGQVLLQQDREIAQLYLAHGTPSMVLVRPDGSIGSPLAQGAEEIRALVARSGGQQTPPLPTNAIAIVADQTNPGGPCPHCGRVHAEADAVAAAAPAFIPLGRPAPALKLPDLGGRTVDLADYRSRETVILFWNPGCGYCQQMLSDLRAWEERRPARAPAVLVVSSGAPEAIKAQGLASIVLHDPNFSTGAAFGVNGTPMAVRIDAAGAVASTPVAGADAVFELLGGRAIA